MFKTGTNGPSAADTDVAAAPVVSPIAATPTGSVWRVVLLLALPVLAQQLLTFAVGLSDRVLAGRLQAKNVGDQAVAYQSAQTTANYLAWLVTSYTVFVGVGSTALVARFVGAGDRENAIHATNQSILLAVVLGLAGSAAGLLGIDPLMRLLGLGDLTARIASDYLQPLFWLLVFQIVESAGIACLVGAGDTRTGLWVIAGVVVVNVFLAWGLFLGWGPLPEMGFVGIALGTALSHVLGCLAILVVLARGRAGLRLVPRLLRPNGNLLWRLLRVSVPSGIESMSQSLGHLWFLSVVNRLGDTAGSAHGIALIWESVTFLSAAAFGTAAMALVGQNLGAGRPQQATRSGWVAFTLGCALMCLEALVLVVFAEQMFLLICPHPEQRPIVEAGAPVLRLIACAMPGLAACIVFQYALRGAGDTRVPVLLTFVGLFLVRLPLAYALTMEQLDLGPLGIWPGANLGLLGAWVAMCTDLMVRGGLFLLRFASGRWQTVRV